MVLVLNTKVIIQALHEFIHNHAAEGNEMLAERWEADKQIYLLQKHVNSSELHGGSYLGATRKWIQWQCKNGDWVEWGSDDVLEPSLTVKDVEVIAAEAAAAAINEFIGK